MVLQWRPASSLLFMRNLCSQEDHEVHFRKQSRDGSHWIVSRSSVLLITSEIRSPTSLLCVSRPGQAATVRALASTHSKPRTCVHEVKRKACSEPGGISLYGVRPIRVGIWNALHCVCPFKADSNVVVGALP